MFEILSEKLEQVFKKLKGRGRLSEKDLDEALRQVRLALLEADVNFKVVKGFTERIRERSLGADVLENLDPAQQVIKVVNEEMAALLGGGQSKLQTAPSPPSVAMLVGLQGSGKTTTAAKLALSLRQQGQRPLLVAADPRRPAAMEQLAVLAQEMDMPLYRGASGLSAKDLSVQALSRARELAATWVIVDTGGRLHIDEPLMQELRDFRDGLKPTETLLVVDAMTGQDAVQVAESFKEGVGLTGLILTKMDGDARGGAALSIRAVSGLPIKFIGTGERVDSFEPFHPDRMASRILGMGDMLTLIEKAEQVFDEKKALELEKKLKAATFDLEDFLEQMGQIKKMGSMGQLAEMIPGVSGLMRRLPQGVEEKQLKKVEAIILSMTAEERQRPDIIGGSRRRRIARGSGTTPQDINQLLNQFKQMQKLIKQMQGKRGLSGLSLLR
ncbi:MAG: signal recognition particle protein [Dehalococcoidia bacterium]